MDWGWYRGSGEELMLLKGRDVKRCRDGGRMVYGGGGASTSSDKEVSWGVVMWADVAWLFW